MFDLSPVLDWFFGKTPTLDDVIVFIETEFAKIREEGAQHRNIDVRNAKFRELILARIIYKIPDKIPVKYLPDVADLMWKRIKSLFRGFYGIAIAVWNQFVRTAHSSGCTSLEYKDFKETPMERFFS